MEIDLKQTNEIANTAKDVIETQKSQFVRLFGDIIFIGPMLVLMSRKEKLSFWDKRILLGIGLATIGYNLRNYIKTENQIVTIPKIS